MSFSTQDYYHMQAALNLARRGLGNVWPNPAVGCVLVSDDDKVISRGWTQHGGRPHAEAYALELAGDRAKGSTAYVTLEPCSHYGQTPPCAKSLIEAGVSRVVVATSDPDSRVSGRGIDMLITAGIKVEQGLLKEEADQINAGFFKRITENRPYVTLKVATTLDGYIATKSGHSQWITGPEARQRGHLLRSQNDAILVGRGTVDADDPTLTTRFSGAGVKEQPVRIVLDSRLKSYSIDSKLCETASVNSPVWYIHTLENSFKSDIQNVEIFCTEESDSGQIEVSSAVKTIAEQGITRLLIEGGGQVAASFIKADLIDEIHWFRANGVIGGDGIPAIASMGLEDLNLMKRYQSVSAYNTGTDKVTILRR